ncbi:tetratricopeptide repeat-containing glycosyltransferase family 2 protein [Thermotoga profunda]|uniref:tetratricopeptide repeat-containing glycosyltransferase family 2 protein n=1 Tax=Thermotoga profunda TaxID=1508420 RepID=UPI000B33EA88|nr:glycosyltransferase family 2 protein [Thermotoga profunda]
MKENSCLLSVAMIVKDEEHNIRRALESIKDVADEIVVVDTGSSDNTPNIVREYTDKLYFHPWKNDFSEARNNSLKYPTCEWVFIFDADEEVSEDFKNGIREFLRSLSKDVNTVYLPTLSYLDWDFKRTETASTPRIFRNGTVHYENIVHNQAIYKPKVVNANFLIYHYGYIWTRKLKKQKYERTATLIRKHLEQCKNDQERLYYLIQLYKTEKTGGKPHQAAEAGWQALQLMRRSTSIPAIGLEFLYIFSIDLVNAGLDDLAIQLAQTAINATPEYPDPYLAMLNAYLKKQEWKKVIEYHEKFKKAVENASKNIEKFGWTIMSFKDIPMADLGAMIAYTVLEKYEELNKLAQERFSKNDDLSVNMIQYLINKIAEKDIEKSLPTLKYLTDFVKRKQLRVNMQPVYEKIVEKRIPVNLSDVIVKDVTSFSYALLKRIDTKQDLMLELLCSGNLENVVKENGVGGLLLVYSLLDHSQKKSFIEKFVEDEDLVVRGVAKAILADHFLKESKFLEAVRLYRDAIQLVPELSQFIKPIVEDLKTRLDSTIGGVYEELYNFYSKQKEFLVDFKKYLGNEVNKLYLLSDNDIALYVSAVNTKDESKAIELLDRIKEPSRFPMYYYRLAKLYSKKDKKKSLSYHIKAVEENEKLADISVGRFVYTGLYPNTELNWFNGEDEILWVGNISEKFTTFGVIHPIRAWFKAKNGLIYAKPYPIDESLKAYENFEKESYKQLPLRVQSTELYETLSKVDWHDVRMNEQLENFKDIFSDLGIELNEKSENILIISGIEQAVELKNLVSNAKRIILFHHVPNLSDENDTVWYYPGFRILRTTTKIKEELMSLGFKIKAIESFTNGLKAVIAEH